MHVSRPVLLSINGSRPTVQMLDDRTIELHPEASKVRIPIAELKACNREIVRLTEVIAKEIGQDVAYAGGAYDGLGVPGRTSARLKHT